MASPGHVKSIISDSLESR